ncbi:MAG: hypothetical protein GY749_46625 [Desulfobacteraceae bacterium]|nr:hypothetical protein [Desulfobacteraceae bacterium]
MHRSNKTSMKKLAVSARTAEAAINVFAKLDMMITPDKGTYPTLESEIEDNKDEMTFTDMPTRLYHMGDTGKLSMTYNKVRVYQLGFGLAYLLGEVASEDAGTGKKFTFASRKSNVDEKRPTPSFSFGMVLDEVEKERWASGFMNSVNLSYDKSKKWVTGSMEAVSTGLVEKNACCETVTADKAVTELTLAYGVQGDSEEERLKNIHSVMAEDELGISRKVTVTGCTADRPAKIAIEPVGSSGTSEYEIIYIAEENIKTETVVSTDDTASITITEAVAGTTASERLANVISVEENSSGTYQPVTYSAVSASDPADITITSSGGTGDAVTYRVKSKPLNGTWHTFPAADISETPLKVTGTYISIGGQWNGSEMVGGYSPDCETNSFEWSMQRGITVNPCFGQGADVMHAGEAKEGELSHTLKFDRKLTNTMYQFWLKKVKYMGIQIKTEGRVYDPDTGDRYTVVLVFPKVGMRSVTKGADGNNATESIEFQVLSHDTYGYMLAIVKTDNIDQYAVM